MKHWQTHDLEKNEKKIKLVDRKIIGGLKVKTKQMKI